MAKKKKNSGSAKPWVTTSELATEIGITAKTLLRQRESYRGGFHYINANPHAARPTYRWHKTRMLTAFSLKP